MLNVFFFGGVFALEIIITTIMYDEASKIFRFGSMLFFVGKQHFIKLDCFLLFCFCYSIELNCFYSNKKDFFLSLSKIEFTIFEAHFIWKYKSHHAQHKTCCFLHTNKPYNFFHMHSGENIISILRIKLAILYCIMVFSNYFSFRLLSLFTKCVSP